jgi:hypothetical protein
MQSMKIVDRGSKFKENEIVTRFVRRYAAGRSNARWPHQAAWKGGQIKKGYFMGIMAKTRNNQRRIVAYSNNWSLGNVAHGTSARRWAARTTASVFV